jgi:hypothetical protein
MGEYADDYYRAEIKRKHGFDPGSMYGEERRPKVRLPCRLCGKHFKSEAAVKDHQRDKHGVKP